MNFSYQTLDATSQNYSHNVFALDVLEGLSNDPKRLYSKYFYDDVGSKIFQEITELPEYYLTNCEAEVLETHKQKILDSIPKKIRLIELGAGDGRKTNILLRHFLHQGLDFEYTPVDISSKAMQILLESLKNKFAQTPLQVKGVVAEYFNAISWLAHSDHITNLVMFLGSNIGNFNLNEAKKFLRYLWNSLNDGDYVLIGFDLKKDISVLNAAYNDSAGVTRRFNLNILQRINNELQANFDLEKFTHFAHYNVVSGAMESWLISSIQQDVTIKSIHKNFTLKAWEGIHTEYSYKYTFENIRELAHDTGFEISNIFEDSHGYFVDTLWKVVKKPC
ncbi:L-histidine N(alpha)-methyltransferase [Candidatus Uabimicrobium amorphum]|uniref:Dimethylhistidine N-methyltransferase n=1 Tax=Uabimicrobium amorphum TaxID=2596890 RepID=A0A5S9IT02_UABAM|nr:L-histidine N(alpha)-methyltransferase [Candidatus Uabimicrobium amorphum]BBM87598.1 dimethylhistidine N-methyltransferase [Candidatus Uabimicrobium amorphum]